MIPQPLFIPVIFGCSKENRTSYTEHAARFVSQIIGQDGTTTELIDARTAIHPYTCRNCNTEQHLKLSQTLQHADGFVWVSPEYNHGYPGELKILLDSFFSEWKSKPVGIVGVSDGGIGGSRVVEQLRLVAIALGMIPTTNAVYFTKVESLFTKEGVAQKADVFAERIKKLLAEIALYAEKLK